MDLIWFDNDERMATTWTETRYFRRNINKIQPRMLLHCLLMSSLSAPFVFIMWILTVCLFTCFKYSGYRT